MANRHTLALSKLEDFKNFLLSDGYEIKEPKGDYEVLRAVKIGRKFPLIVYRKLCTNGGKQLVHLSAADRDYGVVKAYLKRR